MATATRPSHQAFIPVQGSPAFSQELQLTALFTSNWPEFIRVSLLSATDAGEKYLVFQPSTLLVQ